VKRIAERYRNEIAEVFRPFPLPEIHRHAMHAARAAEAAALQGKFWEMHDTLFENQRRLDDASLLEYAANLGLDVEQFKHDFASRAVEETIQQSLRRGYEDGVRGTPSFFLNGAPLEFENYQDLESTIARAVAQYTPAK
jgi:protein-disulfide isomerase